MNIRAIEKSNKLGYLFYIKYDGTKFFSFDEMKNHVTIKGKFREVMGKLNFSWAKGIQQAGRTDSKVSAIENILYVSSNNIVDLNKLKDDFNEISEHLKITSIRLTLPNLAFPEQIAKREYIYKYPNKKIKRTQDEIINLCSELSGTYDVSRFTDSKGKKLLEHVRTVEVSYKNKKLFFLGSSFMPHQVRIMSGYILTNRMEAIEGRYLTLSKIYLNDFVKNMILTPLDKKIENVDKILVSADESLYIFMVKKENKGKLLGKNAKNIKSLRKIYGNIVVREI